MTGPPINIYFYPEKDEYEVGDVITCSADAKPAAAYFWQNLRTLDIIYDAAIMVSSDMRGFATHMRCQAQNVILGFVYTQNLYTYVNVPAASV